MSALPPFIVGHAVRTTNAAESDPQQAQLGALWARVIADDALLLILDRRDLIAVAAGARTHLAVQVLDHTDGMPSSQGNGASTPAGWLTNEGKLLFPTGGGLAVIDPQSSRFMTVNQAAVHIYGFEIGRAHV